MANVAINGLGRIGRATLKILVDTANLNLVAVNDLVPTDNLVYLLKYDTVYGRYDREIKANGSVMTVGNQEYKVFNEKDPANLPWSELDIDIVFECTGVFRKREDLEKHIQAGAKHVILSAPAKSEDVITVVYGVNDADNNRTKVISCASCTTNCIAPVVEVIDRHFGVRKANMTTIHAYTASQGIVDQPSKKMRRGRAGAANLVPTSTGAAIATTKTLPKLKGCFDGVAVRGPVPVGSIADINFVVQKQTTVDEVNRVLAEEAESERYKGVLGVTTDELVSSDIIRDPRASIVDASMTKVIDGDLVKVMSWYDNEWGYSNQMVREAVEMLAERQPVEETTS
jgi:glyceraldehyde 3-phosphate dehydrogenase